MGLFSWLKSAASVAVKVVTTVVQTAVTVVKNVLGANGYNDKKLDDVLFVERTLNEFRASIGEAAREAEEAAIEDALVHFDDFADELKDRFPELVDLVRQRQREASEELTGIIPDYAQEHISENNPAFSVILKMMPGEEKQTQLDDYMNTILSRAEKEFRKELKKCLQELTSELNDRVSQRLESEEDILKNLKETLEELEQQATSDTLDFEKVESECAPVVEVAACIKTLLEGASIL